MCPAPEGAFQVLHAVTVMRSSIMLDAGRLVRGSCIQERWRPRLLCSISRGNSRSQYVPCNKIRLFVCSAVAGEELRIGFAWVAEATACGELRERLKWTRTGKRLVLRPAIFKTSANLAACRTVPMPWITGLGQRWLCVVSTQC